MPPCRLEPWRRRNVSSSTTSHCSSTTTCQWYVAAWHLQRTEVAVFGAPEESSRHLRVLAALRRALHPLLTCWWSSAGARGSGCGSPGVGEGGGRCGHPRVPHVHRQNHSRRQVSGSDCWPPCSALLVALLTDPTATHGPSVYRRHLVCAACGRPQVRRCARDRRPSHCWVYRHSHGGHGRCPSSLDGILLLLVQAPVFLCGRFSHAVHAAELCLYPQAKNGDDEQGPNAAALQTMVQFFQQARCRCLSPRH